MKTGQNIQIIKSLYNSFSTGDMPTVLGLMHSKIEWNEAESNSLADGNPYIGPDAILEGVIGRIGTNHEYFLFEGVEVHGMSDNKVLATLRYNAKVKATEKTYNAQAAHLWTLNEEGEIISFQQFVDTKKLSDSEK